MRRKVPLATQLYQILFPFRAEGIDPSSFPEHVRKHLLPELRSEVRMFYGDELSETLEARFPGLDYTNRVHRLRLSRFPHHRKLFHAMDKLGWTQSEIYHFCDWEGTILVKRRYEMHHGAIRDTAADYIYRPKLRTTPLRSGWHIRNEDVSGIPQLHPGTVEMGDEDHEESDMIEESESGTSGQPTAAEQGIIVDDVYHPQSALAMARQALLASRVSRATASSTLRSARLNEIETRLADTNARRTARIESARAAA